MQHSEVRALRKAFDSVKQRQAQNPPRDFAEQKKRLAASRELCVGNEELLARAVANLKKNGMKVHLAKDGNEAVNIIQDELGGEKLVVKSKSNVTKEIEITKALEKKGLTVVETDIGDRILQILKASPSHPTGPVTHLSAKDIAKGLTEHYKTAIKDDPEDIVRIVREDVISNMNM